MSDAPSAASEPPGDERRAPGIATTLAFGGSLVLLAVLLTTSAQSPPPAEARLGQRVELIELIGAEEARVRSLQARVEELAADVAALEDEMTVDTAEMAALRDEVAALAAPAGLTPVEGPGVTVTLSDSTVSFPSGGDPNDYVIHEQDLQAVINALWAGGAEAMAVNGHRVVATTAIRCVGNVLLLHGRTHSPPYVIEAIGDPEGLRYGLERDSAVDRFARAVQDHKLGFDVAVEEEAIRLSAYEGSAAMQSARPHDAVRG